MEGIGVEVSQKVKSAIKAKLVELGVYVDEELPDYIMVMVANNRSKSEMIDDLQLFLGVHTEKFISWLLQVLQKLQEVTLASMDAKKASCSSTSVEKEKAAKKRKISVGDAETDSLKKDRKKKMMEVAKKDTGLKKGKKGLKNKSAKPEAPKIIEKKSDETVAKGKKELVIKSKEKVTTSVVKSIPLSLPSTSRAVQKPVLMVSDDDDEDFINIRADAEADLLVSELQEEIRPVPPKQMIASSPAKSSSTGSQRSTERQYIRSPPRSSSIPKQDNVKESVVLSHKDVRLQHVDEGGTISKEIASKSQSPSQSSSWSRSESQAAGTSSSSQQSSSSTQRVTGKSSEHLSSRVQSVKRTPAIPATDGSSRHSLSSTLYQADPSKGRDSEEHRPQPSSKITPVSRIGTVKSRLGKRPGDEDDSSSGATRATGLPSVVRVKGRPKVPLAGQANKNLILKAVAEAQKSVASAPIRVEPSQRSMGLLTRKNRENLSKIAVTRPNPRAVSNYDREEWSSQDEVNNNQSQGYETQPKLTVQFFQNQTTPHQQQQIQTVSGLKTQQQLAQSQRHHHVQSQPQAIQTQPQLMQNQSQVMQAQSQLIQNQPQPDLVASLHEGMSSRSSIASVNGNMTDEVMIGDGVVSAGLHQSRNLMDSVNSENDMDIVIDGIDGAQLSNPDAERTMTNLPYAEANPVMGPTMICSVPEEPPVGIAERLLSHVPTESPNDARAGSPQFFVTLSGYDPLPSGAGRVVRGDFGAKTRCFLLSDEMDAGEECLDEGIGEEDSKDAMEGVEETQAEEKRVALSTGPIIFRNIVPNTADDGDSPTKTKTTERCRFWPACRLGERCEYHHPSIPCKAFPACKFGDKCLYIHPNCKFDAACTRKDCPFTHALPRSLVPVPAPAPVRFSSRPAPTQCRFYPKCTNVNCKFYHPKPCRFGNACNKYDCPFMHEREPIPSKEKLKWVCPTKA